MMNGENGNVMQDGEFSGTPRGPSLAEHNPPRWLIPSSFLANTDFFF